MGSTGMWNKRVYNKRGSLHKKEHTWCEACITFLRGGQYESKVKIGRNGQRHACMFGTQTAEAVIKDKRTLTVNNLRVATALGSSCDKGRFYMTIGDKYGKADAKIKDWLKFEDVRKLLKNKKIKKTITGPETLKDFVHKFYFKYDHKEKRPKDTHLTILMMDSGEYEEYEDTFRTLTLKYNVMFIKMAMSHYSFPHYSLLVAYEGVIEKFNKEDVDKWVKEVRDVSLKKSDSNKYWRLKHKAMSC
jgi:hypothetical protein